MQPSLEFVYEANATLGEAVPIGETPDGTRRIVPILSGTVEGPGFAGQGIRGELLPGADWQVTRRDGVTVVDATYALRTGEGVIVQVRNRGLRHGPAEVMSALAAGQDVDPAAYYFRAVPEFLAPAGKYEWLNRSIFVCAGARFARSVRLWVWRIT
ncbi:MAG TPA: DUF3237 domain-containing protein [Bryobacteraceae bacterium]|nr:DUF3237 domain-containing protein [Bryobacteraceae bacterium]